MNDILTLLLKAELDMKSTTGTIDSQLEDLKKKIKPVEIKIKNDAFKSMEKEISNINKTIEQFNRGIASVDKHTSNLAKNIKSVTDNYNKQLSVIQQLNKASSSMESSQSKASKHLRDTAKELENFKSIQLGKLDKQFGDNLSKELKEVRDQIKHLDTDTKNLEQTKNQLRDSVSRSIANEKKALEDNINLQLKEKQIAEQLAETKRLAEQRQSKELWGRSSEVLQKRTSTDMGVEQLNNWYKELEKASIQLEKFQGKQLEKISKHAGTSPSDEMRSLSQAITSLTADTENLTRQKEILEQVINRTIEAEKSAAKAQQDNIKAQLSAEQKQSKELWGMSADILKDRTSINDEIKALNDWYKELEKLDNKIIDFQRNYNQKIGQLQKGFGDSEGLQKFSDELNKLTVETPNVTDRIKEMKVEFRDVSYEARGGATGLSALAMGMGDFAKQALAFAGIHLSIRGVFSALRNGLGAVNEVNASLTEIGMVTNKSIDDVSHLALEYNNLAKDMKVSTKEMLDGAVLYTRQGLGQAEVMERLSQTTEFAKVTNTEFTRSAELLTATVNAMGVDVERASDTFIWLGDNAATSGTEVAEGVSKVSGTAAAMGVEFEKVSAWVAAISERTREDASSIGSSINMIISRMARLTEDGFDEEDGTQINDVAKALNRVGIEIEDQNGNFRNFADVIDELGSKWEGLTDKEKAYIGYAMAGKLKQPEYIVICIKFLPKSGDSKADKLRRFREFKFYLLRFVTTGR